jgi:hypothetical protein
MTLPPIDDQTFDTWQFEWQPVQFSGANPAICSVSGSGYVVARPETLVCEGDGPDGLSLGDVQALQPEEFPDCPNDPRFGAWDGISLTITMGLYLQPGDIIHVMPCQEIPEIEYHAPEITMSIREGSPTGPIAKDHAGVERQFIMSNGIVVDPGGDSYMGIRLAGTPWPRFWFVIDSVFARSIYPMLSMSAVAYVGAAPPPPPPPPPAPPPPTAGPPQPGCKDSTVGSIVGLGSADSGMVPMR